MPAEAFRARTPAGPGELTAPPFPTREQAGDVLSRWGGELSRGVVLGVLAVLVLGSLWLRVRALHFHFWVDEGLSVGIASHPLSAIPSLLRQDGSPPLYYLLLHLWMSLAGRSEVATHELSLIFSLLTIPTAYWAASSLFDRRTGLVCAMLAAGAPYLTLYAQETRMYSLLALLALLVAATFVEAFVKRRRRYVPAFALALAAALYTHNWALFLGLMCAAAFVWCVVSAPRDQRRALWRDGALAFGGAALLYLPWLPTVAYQSAHTGAPWDLPPVFWSLTQGTYSLVGGRGAAVALLLGGGAGLLALWQRERIQSPTRTAIVCLVLLGFGTLLTAWAYSKVTPAWAPRYLAVIVGPLILLFGLGLARAGRLGIAALALVACFWVLDPIPKSLDGKSNVAGAIAAVRPHLRTGALVLSTQPEQVPTIAYYLRGSYRYATPMGLVADPRIVDWRDALGKLRRSSVRRTLMPMLRALAPGQRVVLVVPLRLNKQPLWMELINRDSVAWTRTLNRDRAFVRVATSAAHWNTSGVPVRVTVYAPRSAY